MNLNIGSRYVVIIRYNKLDFAAKKMHVVYYYVVILYHNVD